MSTKKNSPFTPPGFGWVRDLPDPNDFAISNSRRLSRYLQGSQERSLNRNEIPTQVDLRHYFPEVEMQPNCQNSSAAFACTSLFEYFSYRSQGHQCHLSKEFVYRNAMRYQRFESRTGVGIRHVLKAIRRFGTPNSEFCQQQESLNLSDPFLYGFRSFFEQFEYYRLDLPDRAQQTLPLVKAFLDSEIPIVFGASVPSGLTNDGLFPYLPISNSIVGGQCLVAVGYDDTIHFDHQIPSGAVLVRNSWGTQWGDEGYGWVPYRYFEKGLVADCWVVLDESWLYSGAEPVEVKQRLIREIETSRMNPLVP